MLSRKWVCSFWNDLNKVFSFSALQQRWEPAFFKNRWLVGFCASLCWVSAVCARFSVCTCVHTFKIDNSNLRRPKCVFSPLLDWLDLGAALYALGSTSCWALLYSHGPLKLAQFFCLTYHSHCRFSRQIKKCFFKISKRSPYCVTVFMHVDGVTLDAGFQGYTVHLNFIKWTNYLTQRKKLRGSSN